MLEAEIGTSMDEGWEHWRMDHGIGSKVAHSNGVSDYFDEASQLPVVSDTESPEVAIPVVVSQPRSRYEPRPLRVEYHSIDALIKSGLCVPGEKMGSVIAGLGEGPENAFGANLVQTRLGQIYTYMIPLSPEAAKRLPPVNLPG